MDYAAASVSMLRLIVFFSVFFILAIFEVNFPRRQLQQSKSQRWISNIGVSAINTVLVRFALPLAGVGAALLAQEKNWGLLNQFELPEYLATLSFLLLFDFSIYWQHRLFHKIPLLWRLHRMHHTDLDYDVTTGNRFHPGSIMLSAIIKIGLALVLGPSVMAVLVAEILLNVTSMFNHSNIYIPPRADKVARYFMVTPDMHRVHHSVDSLEHNRNFGFNFPWWDRMFGTYQNQPVEKHSVMAIGIPGFQKEQSIKLFSLLKQPFEDSERHKDG